MTPSTATAGSLTLYAQPAYGGWTAHVHDARRQVWMHDWKVYFQTKEEAQAQAVALTATLTGASLPNLSWE